MIKILDVDSYKNIINNFAIHGMKGLEISMYHLQIDKTSVIMNSLFLIFEHFK